MTPQEIQERNKQIALMLGLKPLGRPYDGAFITDDNTDHSFRIFFNGLLEGESWYQYPEFHRNWNWLMEAVEFIEKLKFNTKACIHCNIDRVYLNTYPIESSQYSAKFISITDSKINFCSTKASTKKEAVFIAVSDFAKLYNEKKLYI